MGVLVQERLSDSSTSYSASSSPSSTAFDGAVRGIELIISRGGNLVLFKDCFVSLAMTTGDVGAIRQLFTIPNFSNVVGVRP